MTRAQEHAYLAFLQLAKSTPTGAFYAVQPGHREDATAIHLGLSTDLAGVYRWYAGKFKRAARPNRNGYMRVPFRFRGQRYEIMEHWAVWLYCGHPWPPVNSKLQLNHKDGNRWNNHIDNLELVTQSDNLKHAHRMRKAGHPGGKR